MTADEKALPTPMDLAELMRDFTQSAQEWMRTYARMQSELSRLREELREKNALLKSKERLAALGQMAAGVAHEIRNPLGGIQLYANLLQRSLAGRPADLAVVEKMLSGVRHMERVVQQTLTFAGGMSLNLREADLTAVVRSALAVSGVGESGSGEVKVSMDIPESLICRCDPDLMTQMLANLMVNAQEAMEGAGELLVTARQDAKGLILSVADTGPGVPEELRGKLFDPFVTTKANGGGLGLSIVWRIVEAHGGEIGLDGASRSGARFVIRLPAAMSGSLA